MRGRPRKPTRLKIVEGDAHKVGAKKLQEQLDNEPKPTPGAPRMPSGLTAEARRMWKQTAPELDRLGLLAKVDAGALEALCVAYGRARDADKVIAKEGTSLEVFELDRKGDSVLVGYKKRHEVAISFEAWRQYKAYCTEFGLTSASRSRLSAKSDPADELDQILNAPREPRTA